MHFLQTLGLRAKLSGKRLFMLANTASACAISTAAQAEVTLNVHTSAMVNPVPSWALIAIFVAFAYFTVKNVFHRS